MEWVETTARTVEEAKSLALDQLGVDNEDAEFDVVDEPRPGLFGRLRGEARVRARVRPTRPRPKMERRDRRRKKGDTGSDGPSDDSTSQTTAEPTGDEGDGGGGGGDRPKRRSGGRKPRPAQPADHETDDSSAATTPPRRQAPRRKAAPSTVSNDEHQNRNDPPVDAATVGAEATKFLEGLLRALDVEGQVSCTQDGNELDVRVEGTDLGLMVGPRGATLVALQDLTRVVSQRRLGDHETRLRVDVAGYRERRREALARFATSMADEVVASGVARVLEPMASADRKVIHDVVAERSDVVSRSEGDDPNRRVIIDLPS